MKEYSLEIKVQLANSAEEKFKSVSFKIEQKFSCDFRDWTDAVSKHLTLPAAFGPLDFSSAVSRHTLADF